MLNKKQQQIGIYGFILNKNREVLLVRRATHDTHPNLWELPGGGLAHGEEPEDGVVREVSEEAGIKVKVMFPLGTRSKLSDYDTNKHTLRIAYLCELIDENAIVKLSHEHSQYAWVPLNENPPLPVAALYTKCLEQIKQYPFLLT